MENLSSPFFRFQSCIKLAIELYRSSYDENTGRYLTNADSASSTACEQYGYDLRMTPLVAILVSHYDESLSALDEIDTMKAEAEQEGDNIISGAQWLLDNAGMFGIGTQEPDGFKPHFQRVKMEILKAGMVLWCQKHLMEAKKEGLVDLINAFNIGNVNTSLLATELVYDSHFFVEDDEVRERIINDETHPLHDAVIDAATWYEQTKEDEALREVEEYYDT